MENEKELKELQVHIEGLLKTQETAFEEKNEAKVKEVNESLKGLGDKVEELMISKGVDSATVKELHAEVAKMKEFGVNSTKGENIDKLTEKFLKSYNEKGNPLNQEKEHEWIGDVKTARAMLNTKAAADMTLGNYGDHPSQSFAPDGVAINPRLVHMRSLLSTIGMSTNTLQYEQETARDGTAASAAEGVAVPQLDNDFTSKTATAKKIGGFFRVSEESLEDVVWLSSFLQTAGIERVLKAEDLELLGSSTGFDGFDQAALSDAADNAAYGKTVSDVTKFDALQFAITKLLVNETQANGIIMNPIDYAVIYTATTTEGQALSPLYWVGGRPTIAGIPIYLSTAVTADKYFVGDWSMNTAQLAQRSGLTVKFFEQDADNATEGKVTIRVQERAALFIYKPTNVLYGDFSETMASLSV